MLQEWELYRLSYEPSFRAIDVLIGKKMYGLAAFQTQQALEMLIKACILKYGFREYLRTKVKDHPQYFADFARIDERNPILWHLPSGEILRLTFEFTNFQVKKLEQRHGLDPSLKSVIEEMLDTLKRLVDLTSELEKGKYGRIAKQEL